MTSYPISSIEDLNAALESQNPFAQPPYVGSQEVWGKGLLDVKTLNAHASDAVFQAIEQIRAGQYQKTSIAITAESGTGKTHVISRIRHRLQAEGGALFIYSNNYGDLNQIKYGFQRILATSLKNIGSQGVMQWQELSAAMANQVFKVLRSTTNTLSPREMVKKFGNLQQDKVKTIVNELGKAFCQRKDVSDPDIIKAVFWTLSDEQVLFAVKWLSGEEISEFKADELGLPKQAQSFDAVLQILDLISEYREFVICFDELDITTDYNDAGFTRAQVVAGLVKELFENLRRGVIVTVMMPATWSNKIRQLPNGVVSKVAAQGDPIDLKYMNGDSTVELVTLWLREFYEAINLVPHDSVYPFTESQLRELSKEKPAVRRFLKWCKDNCKPVIQEKKEDRIIDETISDPVELAFKQEFEENIGDYLDNNFLLADALAFGLSTLTGQTIEGIKIEKVTEKVSKKGGKDRYINFKVIGRENGKDVSIGVAVLQYVTGKSLGAGLQKIIDYKTFGLTRGCLVRSKSKEKKISRYLQDKYLNPLILERGGKFIELAEEQLRPMIAIRSVYQKREVDYALSEEDILNFIAKKGSDKKIGASNSLIKEILSAPSYRVPDDVIEEDIATLAEANMADITESADISKLLSIVE